MSRDIWLQLPEEADDDRRWTPSGAQSQENWFIWLNCCSTVLS